MGGEGNWSINGPDGKPRLLTVYATTVQCLSGLGSEEIPAWLRITVSERFNDDVTGPGTVYVDETFDAAEDELTALVLGQPFTLPVGLLVDPFDVREISVKVWVSGGRDGTNSSGVPLANLKVYCETGLAS
jgi:hypothetical protein